MAAITSAGIGSGLDLESIIQATVNAEDLPKMKRLDASKKKLNVELSGLGAVKSAMASLQDIMKKLADKTNFSKRTAEVKQPTSGDLVSITTTDKSTAGNYNIKVVELARGSKAMTNGAFTTSADVVTTTAGTLTLTAGTKTFNVDIAAGAKLSEVRDAINKSATNFGVAANIVNTGSVPAEAKLVLSSVIGGDTNNLVVSNNNSELDKISTVASGGGAAGLTIGANDVAKSAQIEIDGILVKSDSNTFTDAVQDLTITAKKVSGTDEIAKVMIDYDRLGVEKLIGEFVSAFNNTMTTLNTQTKLGGALYGDPAARALKTQLIDAVSGKVTGAGPFETLYDSGLKLGKNSMLEKTSMVRSMTEALTNNYNDVGTLFSGADGIATQLNAMLENHLSSNGSFKKRQDAIGVSIKKVDTDIEKHDYRMTQLEKRLRSQYASLDSLMGQMKSTSNYLSTQLSSLPGFGKN